ncbi:CATRA system-associated protein [Kitasatospora sp. NPDC101235]|uniref:CATRA system-associated protein n=1 Tax=Kitasatospora sp. NPDC101235 TaxID=3364101 RepID=UPI00382B80DC
MRDELNGVRAEALDILEDITRARLAPDDWQEVEALLAVLAEALFRGDRAAFRRELYRLEDLAPLDRAPRALTGASGATEPVLERTAVLVERLGPPEDPAQGASGQDSTNGAGEQGGHEQ